MPQQISLEQITDARGRVSIGFLATGVLYVCIQGHISERVGGHYAQHLARCLETTKVIRLFKDCSQLASCDLLARSAAVRVMLEHRRRLVSMTVLTSARGITLSNHHLDTILESTVEYTTDLAVFESRLVGLAPLPRQRRES